MPGRRPPSATAVLVELNTELKAGVNTWTPAGNGPGREVHAGHVEVRRRRCGLTELLGDPLDLLGEVGGRLLVRGESGLAQPELDELVVGSLRFRRTAILGLCQLLLALVGLLLGLGPDLANQSLTQLLLVSLVLS